jgi:DNA-binding response OmpR family regulator
MEAVAKPDNNALGMRGAVVIAAREDDPLADRIQALFESMRCICVRCDDPQRLSWLASVRRPAAVLVVGVCEAWLSSAIAATRSTTQAALIVIGRPNSTDVMRALADGVDAVVTDRIQDEELFARVSAIVRRTSIVQDPGVRYLQADEIRLDLWAKNVRVSGHDVELSPTEYRLLTFLMRNSGRAVPAARLIDQIWGWSEEDGLNTLRIFVGRVRRKLHDAGVECEVLSSVRRFGYRFDVPVIELSADENAHANDQSNFMRSATALAHAAVRFSSYRDAAEFLTKSLVSGGAADSSAVLRIREQRLEVVGYQGLSQAWCDVVCPSIPLDPRFASVRAVENNQLEVLSRASAHSAHLVQTVNLLASERAEYGVFMPIMVGSTCWGTMGALSKSGRPYTAATLAYFQLIVAVFAAALSPALTAQ